MCMQAILGLSFLGLAIIMTLLCVVTYLLEKDTDDKDNSGNRD